MTIRAGTMKELTDPTGDWCFVDIGFAGKAKSCGYLLATFGHDTIDKPFKMTYGELGDTLCSLVVQSGPPLHLVLEAPISSAFTPQNNPVGRSIEKAGSKTRYWYVGLGCSVLVSSLYLIKRLAELDRNRELRIFEGFVSFKDRNQQSDHIQDVRAMKRVVWSRGADGGDFCEPIALSSANGSMVRSTMELLGLDATPPPIIRVGQ